MRIVYLQEVRFANFLPATLPEMQWLRRAADGLDLRSMDYVLDRRLIHRDEQKIDELLRSSEFGRNCTRVLFGLEQINLFAECVRD